MIGEETEYQPQVSSQFAELQNAITGLLPSNAVDAKFLLRSIFNISDDKFVLKLLEKKQNQFFKIPSARMTNVMNLIKTYYETRIQSGLETIHEQEQAYSQLSSVRHDLSQFVARQIKTFDQFKVDYFVNVTNLQTINQNFNSRLKQSLINSENAIGRWKNTIVKMRAKLEKQIQILLKCFLDQTQYQGEINQISDKIAYQLNFQVLLIGPNKTVIQDAIIPKIIHVIQHFDSFIALKEYGVQDINLLKIDFVIKFYKKFATILPFNKLSIIKKELILNPQYFFTSRNDLSDSQKQELIKWLWVGEENVLSELITAYKHKDTLSFKVQSDIQSILYYLIFTVRYNYSVEEFQQIKYLLNNRELVNFFDDVQHVNYSLKSTYQFITKNCTNYMKSYNNEVCSVKMKIQKQLLIKKKLYENIQSFSISDWEKLETSIINGNTRSIQEYIENIEVVNNLKNWMKQNLADYMAIISKQQTLTEKVKVQLTDFFVKRGIIGLNFKQIMQLVNQLLEQPYFQDVESSRILTVQQVRDMKDSFLALQKFNNYKKCRKIDLQLYERIARVKIQQEIQKLNYQNNYKIHYQVKNKLIDQYLKNPKSSTIYQNENIGDKYKKKWLQTVSKIQQVKTYIQNFERIECIMKQDAYLKMLAPIFKRDLQVVKQFVCVYGLIPSQISDKQYINISNILKSIDRKKIEQLQTTKQFKEFFQYLPLISIMYRKECRDKIIFLIKKIFSTKDQYNHEDEEQMMGYFQSKLQSSDISSMLNNQKFQQGSKFENLKQSLSQQQKYKWLLTCEKNILNNKKLFAKIDLQRKIVREVYHHQSLMNILPEEKEKLLQKVAQKCEFDEIQKYQSITDEQRKNLMKDLADSQQYKDYKSFEGSKSAPISNAPPVNNSNPEAKIPQTGKYQIPKKNLNPEVKPEQQKKVIIPPKVEQAPEHFEDPILMETPSEGQSSKIDILAKWNSRLETAKEKNGYFKPTRDNEYRQDPTKLVEVILLSHPWNDEASISWAGTAKFKRTNFVKQVSQCFSKYEEEGKKDVELLRKMFK